MRARPILRLMKVAIYWEHGVPPSLPRKEKGGAGGVQNRLEQAIDSDQVDFEVNQPFGDYQFLSGRILSDVPSFGHTGRKAADRMQEKSRTRELRPVDIPHAPSKERTRMP